jgi:serine/threonine protein kinase
VALRAQGVEFGTGRFEVTSRLGEGGMGVVYAAIDRERGVRVAIKTLRTMNAEALLRFKNEFRALQDVEHENLISLGELIEDAGQWFFTMELIDGVNLLSYVRAGHDLDERHDAPSRADTGPVVVEATGQSEATSPGWSDRSPPYFDETRLRSCLVQLTRGLAALHAAGKVHRDIKPSNVLVTADGRVVLVDFGLVTELVQGESRTETHAIGTTAYMAPEQAIARRVGTAADWYSVGTVLYQVLTGRLPFDGTGPDILRKKASSEPPAPRERRPDVPRDLDALCVALLRPDPAARPSAREVMHRLAMEESHSRSSLGSASSLGLALPFVGRERELLVLDRAFLDGCEGKAVTVVVRGESGVGKTALVSRFAEGLGASTGSPVVVLSSRCYERESVPYKALDGVVDALSRHMKKLDKIDAVALLPVRAAHLAQVFPALKQVEAVAEVPRPLFELLDPQELRMRVFSALRELLTRLADRHPLVVCIDDLQWADSDSLALLHEILRPPDAPSLLLVATVRKGTETSEPVLKLGSALVGDVRYLDLERLPRADARELATRLFERAGMTGGDERAHAIAAEADGHPLFIDELVRHSLLMGATAASRLQLDEALWARVTRLDDDGRRLLELVCVAGAPLSQQAAALAFGGNRRGFDRSLASLRVAHLIRTTGARVWDSLLPYHDRIRDALLLHLDPIARQAWHEKLALSLEADETSDPEALARHWAGAGDARRGATYAATAASLAAKALAWGHAAQLYRFALALLPPGDPEIPSLHAKLGEVLANAGLGAEAAASFQAATAGMNAAQALDLRRKAAEQLLRAGHVDQGLAAIRTVLDTVGMSMPSTPQGALLSLAWHRARTRLFGLGYRRRDESEVSARELMQVDTCWSIASGLAFVDIIRGADFQTRHLLLALAAGEPSRIAKALAAEAGFAGSPGRSGQKRSARLYEMAKKLVDELDHPHATGLLSLAAGIIALFQGRWREALEHGERADAVLRERCTGVTWELTTASTLLVVPRFYLGRVEELGRIVPLCLRDFQTRGDLYGATCIRTGDANLAWLLKDDPEGARREANDASRSWSMQGVVVQNYMDLIAQVQIDIYLGDGRVAHNRLTERWPALSRSLLLRVQIIRILSHFARARAALAASEGTEVSPSQRKELLKSAERDAAQLERERMPWSDPLAKLVRAGTAASVGDSAGAQRLLRAARAELDAAGMALYAASARYREGELLGGDAGQELTEQASSWLANATVQNPARMIALLAPGFARRS